MSKINISYNSINEKNITNILKKLFFETEYIMKNIGGIV